MGDVASVGGERIRTAEVIAATCLATDLGMGFPFEHGLHATLMAMRLAELLEVDRQQRLQTYYASQLAYAGCTTYSDVSVRIFAGERTRHIVPVAYGSPLQQFRGVIRALPPPDRAPYQRGVEVLTRLPQAARHTKPYFAAFCEVAAMLAERLGLPGEVSGLFGHLTERWNGKSVLRRAKGEEIPVALRIVHVARDAAYQRLIGGDQHAVDVVGERAGEALDPAIAHRFVREAQAVLGAADTSGSVWEATLAAEPHPWPTLEGAAIDRALAAMGSFADLASPYLSGHSSGVAGLAAAAAELSGLDPAAVATVRRAGLLHDVGRAGVDPRVWQKAGALSADDWEQVRLHPYHTERVFARAPVLASLAGIAGCHHERLDASGYHRGLTAVALPPAARLLAAADAFHAMTEPRPHRAPLPRAEAAGMLADDADAGRHDPDVVAALLEAAGEPTPEIARPAGLTDRETQVLGLLARGLLTKQVARELRISPKTADRHIQNAYHKIGVSTRAGATLFAVEHGLVAWGELPIPGRSRPR